MMGVIVAPVSVAKPVVPVVSEEHANRTEGAQRDFHVSDVSEETSDKKNKADSRHNERAARAVLIVALPESDAGKNEKKNKKDLVALVVSGISEQKREYHDHKGSEHTVYQAEN